MHHSRSLDDRRTSQRGVTLIELLVVVVITGILATIAIASVKKYVASAKTSEATELIRDIKSAEESHKEQYEVYWAITTGLSGSGDFFPNNPSPGRTKMNFPGTGTNADRWQVLTVHPDAPVLFVYGCSAGNASTKPTDTGTDITVPNWPTAALGMPWYVVKAKGDIDGDGIDTVFLASSFAGAIFTAND